MSECRHTTVEQALCRSECRYVGEQVSEKSLAQLTWTLVSQFKYAIKFPQLVAFYKGRDS